MWALIALALATWLTCSVGRAQTGVRALPAVWLAPRLAAPAVHTLLVSADVGYGVMGAVAGTGGPHHRAAAGVGVGYSAPFGLGLELRFDGRWDVHRVPGGDDSLVGEPRLLVRYAHAVGAHARLGLEAGAWVPGSTAPSLQFGATSVDVLALAELALPKQLSVVLGLGPRFDRSARSVPSDLELSASDRISLGVSSYHALLSRLALAARFGVTEAALELSADTLLGDGAPRFVDSPLRAALVARHPLGAGFEGVAQLSMLLSGRPALSVGEYAPFEPRALLLVGARYGYGRTPKAVPGPAPAALAPAVAAAAVEPVQTSPPPAARGGSLVVQVENTAAEPLPDVEVALDQTPGQRTGGKGSVHFEALAAGEHVLQVRADGFVAQERPVSVVDGSNQELRVVLEAARQESVLRVQVRDAESGAPLSAQLTLTARAGKQARIQAQTGADGSFERSLPSGRYRLALSLRGYQSQAREIEVSERGVTLFNVDLTPVGTR